MRATTGLSLLMILVILSPTIGVIFGRNTFTPDPKIIAEYKTS